MKPFVVDMRHELGSDPTYGVAQEWKDALEIAAAFWRTYDGSVSDPSDKSSWKPGEGYDEEISIVMRKGTYFNLIHAGGEGTCINIQRAKVAK